jgi:F0F1-type ATP synthase membrane subunit b/b'
MFNQCKAIYGITGEALRRYDDSKNDRYLQAKQREKDGTMVYSKMNEIEKNVKTKVAYIQRQSEDTKVALEDQFNKLKNQANNSVAEIKKAADYAKAACDHINTNMKVAVEKEMNNFTVKIRKEFQTNIQNLEKGVDVIESNLNIVHEKLTSWRTVSEMKQVVLENRITAIENHIMTIQSGTNLNFAPYKPNQQEIQMLQQQQQINQPQQIRFGQQHNHTQQQQQLIQTNLNPQNVLQQASPYINNINPIANNANSFHIGSQSLQHVT